LNQELTLETSWLEEKQQIIKCAKLLLSSLVPQIRCPFL